MKHKLTSRWAICPKCDHEVLLGDDGISLAILECWFCHHEQVINLSEPMDIKITVRHHEIDEQDMDETDWLNWLQANGY